jgi:hypothetical protein
MAKNKSKTSPGMVAAEIGAGVLAAAAAAGTGYYYFYASDKAKKHRKIAAKWANDLKREVVREAKAVGAASPKAFATIVDEAAGAYATAKNVRREDVLAAAAELKKNWEILRSEYERAAREAKKPTRTASRAVKKVAKRSKAAGARAKKKVRR